MLLVFCVGSENQKMGKSFDRIRKSELEFGKTVMDDFN
jgi:hypothetical protein